MSLIPRPQEQPDRPRCDFEDTGEAIDGFQVTPGGRCTNLADVAVDCPGSDNGEIYFCGGCADGLAEYQEVPVLRRQAQRHRVERHSGTPSGLTSVV